MPVSKLIPIHLIDEPEVAMRTDIPDEYIATLAQDIGRVGLINPVTVDKVGQRYRLHAGHCRLLAHKLMGRENIECRDYTGEDAQLEAMKFSENRHRLDVSDADMATYLDDIQKKHNYTLEQLQSLTGESEHWLSQRLSLFRGDKAVFDALREQKIKLGHALELNRFPDEYRAQYLHICIESTPPVRLLKEWYTKLKQMVMSAVQTVDQPGNGETAAPLPGVQIEGCEICTGTGLNWTMKFYRIHEHCWRAIAQAILTSEKG